ncbi:uncharacterized protein SAPINGB_P004669 [Magnusiomyces paraingens]|uniref:Derlin n=1 Tax=Magnusiomyces paraingens TaxID=2606893 RepID=A0A5E8BVC5_9ASCO|nr:uncharacterized protein SAPINGB_P004669 [Saprochaete ingens]VVT55618.1 unnamed protein product [Saprochaete ingens]
MDIVAFEWLMQMPLASRVLVVAILVSSTYRREIQARFLISSSYFPLLDYAGPLLTNSLVYVWARRHPHEQLSLLGLVAFRAPYLPWIMLGVGVLMDALTGRRQTGGSGDGGILSWIGGIQMAVDLAGVFIGHAYFFWSDVLPEMYPAEGNGGPFTQVNEWVRRRADTLRQQWRHEPVEIPVDEVARPLRPREHHEQRPAAVAVPAEQLDTVQAQQQPQVY